MAKLPEQRDETLGGYVVHNIPFPVNDSGKIDPQSQDLLRKLTPITIEQEYKITYLHSYGQDSPWFAALTNRRLIARRDAISGYAYANPRGHDMYSGREMEWIDITDCEAHVHAFTVCYFGSEEFLPETPFVLALIEFKGINTLLLTRLMGVDADQPSLEWIVMEVRPRFLRNSKLKPTDVYFIPA